MSALCTSYVVDAADHVNAMYFGLVPPHMSQGLLCTPSPPNDSIVKVGCPPTALQLSVNTHGCVHSEHPRNTYEVTGQLVA